MLGGEIAVDSRSGQGSTFTIRLPADLRDLRASEPTAETPAETARAPTDSTNLVLVIDDDPPTRDLLSRFLTRDGYVVRTAGDGEAGLALARTLRPRAILLDVMMPRMDGWAVLSALKADRDLADIPVIMISIVHEKNLGLSLGAAEYLTKPIQWRRLKRVLARFRCPHPPCPVLVVEDDDTTRAMLRQILEKQGWAVQEAPNGRIALARLEAARPALILLDLQMPEMNGFAFIQEMRKRAEWRDIPVLVVTARDITFEEREKLQGNVQGIMRKDEMTPEALAAEVGKRVAAVALAAPRETEGTDA
jgi:CheY-like chemotaxis protein